LNINNSIHDYEELEKSLDEINDEINEREETFVTTMIKNTRKDEFKKYILEKRHSDEELSNAVEKYLPKTPVGFVIHMNIPRLKNLM